MSKTHSPPSHAHRGPLALALVAVTLLGCDDSNPPPPSPQERAIDALGGLPTLLSIETMQLEVTGAFSEFHQEGPELTSLAHSPATFNYTQLSDRDADALRLDWNQNFIYPFGYEGESTLTIAGTQGSIEGVQGFGSRYFGQSAATPLYSSRLEAIRKTQLLANPLALLTEMVEAGSTDLTLPLGAGLPSVHMTLDPTTHLPTTATVMESDALLGDVSFVVAYDNWQPVGDTHYPRAITHTLASEVVRTEEVTNIELNPATPADTFEVLTSAPYDPEQGRVGTLASQWYNRMFAFGFSQDLPLDQVQIEALADGVYTVTGSPELGYVSLAVEVDEGLVLLEPSLNHHRSAAVLTAIQTHFEGQPIYATVATHQHMDHFGGVRTFAGASDKLFVGAASVPFVHEVLESTHDLVPDGYGPDADVEVVAVNETATVGSGEHAFELLTLPTDHSDDMLVAYFPAQRLLFVADIFNGGFVFGWEGYTEETRAVLRERAVLLLDFVTAQGLQIDTIVGVHGSPSPMQELVDLANL